MSAIEKAAAMLRQEAEGLKASHTLRGDWCGDPAEADYHEMIAAAGAAIAERDALRTELNEIRYGVAVAHDTIKALRAKITEMEQQEPIAWVVPPSSRPFWGEYAMQDAAREARQCGGTAKAEPLYALPGAQPAPSVPDTYAAGINAVAAMLQSKADEYAKEHGHDDMGGLSFGPGMGGEIKMDYYTTLIELTDDVRAMLAAAPEAKP